MRELLSKYKNLVGWVLNKYGYKEGADPEDLRQECYLKIVEQIKENKEIKSIDLVNTACTYLRNLHLTPFKGDIRLRYITKRAESYSEIKHLVESKGVSYMHVLLHANNRVVSGVDVDGFTASVNTNATSELDEYNLLFNNNKLNEKMKTILYGVFVEGYNTTEVAYQNGWCRQNTRLLYHKALNILSKDTRVQTLI